MSPQIVPVLKNEPVALSVPQSMQRVIIKPPFVLQLPRVSHVLQESPVSKKMDFISSDPYLLRTSVKPLTIEDFLHLVVLSVFVVPQVHVKLEDDKIHHGWPRNILRLIDLQGTKMQRSNIRSSHIGLELDDKFFFNQGRLMWHGATL